MGSHPAFPIPLSKDASSAKADYPMGLSPVYMWEVVLLVTK